MSTHTGIATTALGVLDRVTLPTPTPGPDEVLVDAQYTALGPFDGYQLYFGYFLQPNDYPRVLGLGGSGIVKAVGSNVAHVQPGDRVATYNLSETKNKALQQYPLVHRFQVAKIPDSITLEDAATVPDNYTTAMYTVFGTATLAFPIPAGLAQASAAPDRKPVDLAAPVLVYGAGATSGQFMVQAFRIAGCMNIVAVASSHHHALLRALGATACVDYRAPDAAAQIRAAAGGKRFAAAVDVVASRASLHIVHDTLAPAPPGAAPTRLALLAPVKDGDAVTNARDAAMHVTIPPWLDALFADARGAVELLPVYTFQLHADAFAREHIMPVWLPTLLERGAVRPNAVRLLKGGSLLERVKEGVELLHQNKISGEKVVVEHKE